ncbi:MAG: hypothetical protein IJI37_05930 [Opitutales bacterium]|nr:hypothetical protein [Opitutales bacterium]
MRFLFAIIILSFSLGTLWSGEKQNGVFANVGFAEGARNYLCKKCASHVCMKSMPASAKCPKGGIHQWHDLGECGTLIYQCAKCSTIVGSKRIPNYAACPSGGLHDWKRL